MTRTPQWLQTPVAKRVLAAGIVGAALGIAALFYVINAGPGMGGGCTVDADRAAAVDAAAQGELAGLQVTGSGRDYSDLKFEDETGAQKTLADFSGTPLLVNFWATWCIPCRQEMPALNAVAGAYDTKGFQVVPVNLDIGEDGIGKARTFLDDMGLKNLTLYADPSYDAFERLKTSGVALGLPATLILNEKGCEIAVLQGPAEWDSPDGHAVIKAALGNSKAL